MSILQASRFTWDDRTKWRNTLHNVGCQSARTTVIVGKAISQVSQVADTAQKLLLNNTEQSEVRQCWLYCLTCTKASKMAANCTHFSDIHSATRDDTFAADVPCCSSSSSR